MLMASQKPHRSAKSRGALISTDASAAIIGVIVFIALSDLLPIRTSEVSAKFRRYTPVKESPGVPGLPVNPKEKA